MIAILDELQRIAVAAAVPIGISDSICVNRPGNPGGYLV
jgi:hypothetical protein